MRLGKDAMWRQMDMPLADALDYLRSQLTIELSTEDAIEGVRRSSRSASRNGRDDEWPTERERSAATPARRRRPAEARRRGRR